DSAQRIRYYHQDHLGSLSYSSDSLGETIEQVAYYPFGFPRNDSHPQVKSKDYRFSQKENDAESCLAYFEARFNACAIARFTSTHSLTIPLRTERLRMPQRLNLYSYVENRPTILVDITGNWGTKYGFSAHQDSVSRALFYEAPLLDRLVLRQAVISADADVYQ